MRRAITGWMTQSFQDSPSRAGHQGQGGILPQRTQRSQRLWQEDGKPPPHVVTYNGRGRGQWKREAGRRWRVANCRGVRAGRAIGEVDWWMGAKPEAGN